MAREAAKLDRAADDQWNEIQPLLKDSVAELGTRDQQAILLSDRRGKPGQQEEAMKIFELREAAKGVWFPTMAGVRRSKYAPRDGDRRIGFRCDDVVANDPAFDPKIFLADIPDDRGSRGTQRKAAHPFRVPRLREVLVA